MSLEHETDLATLQQAVRLLEQENRKLVRLNLELRQALAEAKGEQVQQLEMQIAALEQTLASRNGPCLATRPSDVLQKSAIRRGNSPPASQPQTGHGPRQQDLPIIERVHELDVADRVCTACGGKLDEWKGQFEESTEIDLLERRFVQLRHKRKKYRCSCGGCIETAPGPLKLIPGGRYSIDIAISTAVAKYADHMPLERLSRALERHGLEVDSQTLWDQINALARVIAPVHDALQAHVLAQPCIGADETHWKVLGIKGAHGKAKRWQVWAVSAPDAVCYRIKAGRGLEHAADVLGDYRGTVVCDGYSVYESLRKQQRGILLAHCWAHVRRKFFEVEELQPGTCGEVLDLIAALFDIERRARDADADSETLMQLRTAEAKPIVSTIQQWALAQRALPQSPLRKAVDYMGGLWTGLTAFLERADVPIDNNATERALRGIVLGRKNHFGSRSQRGTEVAALFYSVIETAKLVGVDPYDYLRVAAHAALRGEPIPLPRAAA